MQGVVHSGTIFIGLCLTALGSFQQRLSLGLTAVVKDRGGAAAGSRPGTGEEVVRRYRPAKGEGEVCMGVDSTRKHQFAGGVNHVFAGKIREIAGNDRDLAVLHAQIGFEHLPFCYDGAIANNQVHK